MSAFELNKIVGAVLLAVLVMVVIGKFGDNLVTTGGGHGAEEATVTAKAKKPKSDNRFTNLVSEVLSGSWAVKAPNGDGAITLTSEKGDIVRFPVNRTLMSIKGDPGKQEWDLAFGADDQTVVTLMSGYAANNDVKHSVQCVTEQTIHI